MEKVSKSAEVKVLKVGGDNIVYGFAIVCTQDFDPYYDLQGDHIPEAVMTKASTEFMATTKRDVKEMHLGVCKGQIVHSLPLTSDLAVALGLGEIDRTGWIIGMQPADPAIIEKFADGTLTGFSIGGLGEFEPVEVAS